jgi:hypothetical protein
MMRGCALLVAAVLGCMAGTDAPIVIELDRDAEVTRRFAIDRAREVTLVTRAPTVAEAWAEGAAIAGRPQAQLEAGGSEAWLAPQVIDGELVLTLEGNGPVTLTVHGRGEPAPGVDRARALAWFDAGILDDSTIVSFASVLAAIAEDGHGGALLHRWFSAFAAGPGAGRATFAQFLREIEATQGGDPTRWNLAALPMKLTGVHNRHDLAGGQACGELRVSIASSHPTFSPVHLIFLFAQPARADDVTPDGFVHCRGTARRWARLGALDRVAFATAARELIATSVTRESFLLAESLELSISPWQWRQWRFEADGRLTNPPLFQTVDVARVDAPGPLRDAFLAEVRANAGAIAARTWTVPAQFSSPVADVQPNARAPLVQLSADLDPSLALSIGMIGCPRCHTDDADFLHTGFDRRPSPFYDKELDARAARLDAITRGEWPPPPPFGPLQLP